MMGGVVAMKGLQSAPRAARHYVLDTLLLTPANIKECGEDNAHGEHWRAIIAEIEGA